VIVSWEQRNHVPSGQLARLSAYFRFVCLFRSTRSASFSIVSFYCLLAGFMALSGLKDLFRGFVGNFSATAAQDDEFFRVSSGGERDNMLRRLSLLCRVYHNVSYARALRFK
jgi:hypothetical protein